MARVYHTDDKDNLYYVTFSDFIHPFIVIFTCMQVVEVKCSVFFDFIFSVLSYSFLMENKSVL